MTGFPTAFALAVAPLTTPIDDYSIATIEFRIAKDAVLGSMRAGILCFPAGRVRWRDVPLPDDSAATARLNRTLEEEGLSVAVAEDPIFADPPPPTRYRIRVVVVGATLRLCKPGSPIGPQVYKGSGTMTVVWETHDRQARADVKKTEFTVPLTMEADDEKRDTAALNAIEQSARLYARTRPARTIDR